MEDLAGIDSSIGIQMIGSDDTVNGGTGVLPGNGINGFPFLHFMPVCAGGQGLGFGFCRAFWGRRPCVTVNI